MSIQFLVLGVRSDKTFITAYERQAASWKRNNQVSGACTFYAWEDLADANKYVSLTTNIASADIILCIISANFLATLSSIDFLWDALYAKAKDMRYKLIPVVVAPCDWDEDPIFAGKAAMLMYTVKGLAEKTYQVVARAKRAVELLEEERKKNPLIVPSSTTALGPFYCHKCGAELDPGAGFCSDCGKQVQRKSPPATFQNYYKPEKRFLVVYPNNAAKLAKEGMQHLQGSGFAVDDLRNNVAGTHVPTHFEKHMQQANCLLVFVNASFLGEPDGLLAQFYQHLNELVDNEVPIYYVIAGYCGWQYAPELSGTTPYLGLDGKPLNSTTNRDAFWQDFCEQMHQETN